MINKDYNFSELKEVTPTPHLDLPEIEEVTCYTPKDGSPYYLFTCQEIQRYKDICPICHKAEATVFNVHGTLENDRLIHDVNRGIYQIDIKLRVKRYKCLECDAIFARPFSAIVEGKQMTKRLEEQIQQESFSSPFSDVATKYGYTSTTIANIFDDYAAELEDKRKAVIAPRVLGIDEKHIVHAARGVFVDIENSVLLEITKNNKKADVIETIKSMVDYDKNIEVVTMDMSCGYRAFIEQLLGNVTIVVDKFHVIQDLYTKVSSTKTQLMKYISESISALPDTDPQKAHKKEVYSLLAKNSWLFRFGQSKLEAKGKRLIVMAEICQTFPEFNHLRLLKEGLERVYEAKDRTEAEALLIEWQNLVPPESAKKGNLWESDYLVQPSLFKDFVTLKRAITSWKDNILNYFDSNCRFTNATTEGLNNLIGHLNTMGNGYSFKRLRAKALFLNEAAPKVMYSAKTVKNMDVGFKDMYGFGNSSHFDNNYEEETVFETIPIKAKRLTIAETDAALFPAKR